MEFEGLNRTSYPITNLNTYELVSTARVESIAENGAIILDRPTSSQAGDFLCGDGERVEIGMEVKIYRSYANLRSL